MTPSIRTIDSIAQVPAAQWNALALGGNPFLRHEFLCALEQEGCASKATGWAATHLIAEDSSGQLAAALPLYSKTHSWGEFVFDWSWANAYAQAGLQYYPKLVSMAPFTPVPGARLLVTADESARQLRTQLVHALMGHARSHSLSSAHVLFTTGEDRCVLAQHGFLLRKDCQFHWHNRGYGTFDDFMMTFRAEKRKKALRERRRIEEAGIRFRTLHGTDMSNDLWRTVFAFSAATFESRGHEHYLNVDFFKRIAHALPNAIMIKLALLDQQPLAAAIFFRSSDTLYGRYWGAAADFHSLHFETCYYQGIEYCIEQQLQRFEPGTQGEHKVARGFEPSETWSAHWIADMRFRRAIERHLRTEAEAIDQYMDTIREHLPFRRD